MHGVVEGVVAARIIPAVALEAADGVVGCAVTKVVMFLLVLTTIKDGLTHAVSSGTETRRNCPEEEQQREQVPGCMAKWSRVLTLG